MRRGSTFLEILLVLTLVALLAGLALPRFGRSLDGILARQAAERVSLAHGRARAVALAEQRIARVIVTADSLVVLSGDSLRWRLPGPAVSGASLEGGAAETAYAPNGLAMGAANTRYVVRRGAAIVEILISRLGRVRLVRIGG
jgi:Tfp pilus assembly protein FimT